MGLKYQNRRLEVLAWVAGLALYGCSSQAVRPIGIQQYVVAAKAEQAYAKATETCDKQERKWVALENPPGSPANEFRFECVNSYDIVPAGADSYRIRVFTADIPVKHVTIPASDDKPADTQWGLDAEPAERDAKRRATEYCVKTNRSMKVTGGGFVTGQGISILFMCVMSVPIKHQEGSH